MSEAFSGALHTATACALLSAPFGQVAIWTASGRIVRVALSPEPLQAGTGRDPASPAAAQLRHQIARYFEDPSHRVEFEAAPLGTAFQQRVWQALSAIPPGEVRTYGDLARSLGSGPRAVAGALKANPWPLLIPCHRIVGRQNLGGYCGHIEGPYLGIKRWLLLHEGGH